MFLTLGLGCAEQQTSPFFALLLLVLQIFSLQPGPAAISLNISIFFMVFACFFGAQPSNKPSTLAMLVANTFSSCMPPRCVPQDLNQGRSRSSSSEVLFFYLGSWIQNRCPQLMQPTYQPEPDDQEILLFFFCCFGLGSQEAIQTHASTSQQGVLSRSMRAFGECVWL